MIAVAIALPLMRLLLSYDKAAEGRMSGKVSGSSRIIFFILNHYIKHSFNPLLRVEALVAVAVAQLEMEHIASVAVGAYRAKIGTYAHSLPLAHIDR